MVCLPLPFCRLLGRMQLTRFVPGTSILASLIMLEMILGGSRIASAQAPSFRGETLALTSDGSPYFSGGAAEVGGTYLDLPQPKNLLLTGYSHTYTGPQGDVTFNAAAAVSFRGMFSTGSYAYGTVTNAYYPTDPSPSTTPPFGYYVLGGGGSWTQDRFLSPEALTDPSAEFHWHVSGTTNVNFGTANSRLDFAVTTGATSADDIYNPTITPNLLTGHGPGTYIYNTGVAMDTPLDFLCWSSSYWEVDPDQLATLGSSHRNLNGNASFFSTFNLDSISLFNGDGTLVTDWSLVDGDGNPIFTQDGRVQVTPEPGSIALLVGMGLSGAGFLACRRKSASKAA